jgi:hypothetical protein
MWPIYLSLQLLRKLSEYTLHTNKLLINCVIGGEQRIYLYVYIGSEVKNSGAVPLFPLSLHGMVLD